MKILKKDLLAALELPAKLASRRTSLPILNCVKLEASQGVLTIQASDIASFVSIDTECDGTLDAVCIPASRFQSAIHFAPSENIEMTLDGKLLRLNTGDRLAIATLDGKQFPEAPERGKQHGVCCADLSTAINAVRWACRKEDLFDYSSSVHILLTPKVMLVEGYGGIKAALFEMPLISASAEFVVGWDYCASLACFLNQPECVMSMTEKAACATFKGGFYSCQQGEHKFPNTHDFWHQKKEKIGVVSRDKLLTKFRALNSTLPNPDKIPDVKLGFLKKSLSIHLNGTEESFDSEILGAFSPLEARVNGRSIQEALEAFDSESEITIKSSAQGLFLESGNLTVASAGLK